MLINQEIVRKQLIAKEAARKLYHIMIKRNDGRIDEQRYRSMVQHLTGVDVLPQHEKLDHIDSMSKETVKVATKEALKDAATRIFHIMIDLEKGRITKQQYCKMVQQAAGIDNPGQHGDNHRQ